MAETHSHSHKTLTLTHLADELRIHGERKHFLRMIERGERKSQVCQLYCRMCKKNKAGFFFCMICSKDMIQSNVA